jgi:hypothetical protein|tara:strand:+ start:396 stop:716 length:321 start_codon:yes stop_codon:yes gene_type:complete
MNKFLKLLLDSFLQFDIELLVRKNEDNKNYLRCYQPQLVSENKKALEESLKLFNSSANLTWGLVPSYGLKPQYNRDGDKIVQSYYIGPCNRKTVTDTKKTSDEFKF